jgi:hypothetical protein
MRREPRILRVKRRQLRCKHRRLRFVQIAFLRGGGIEYR